MSGNVTVIFDLPKVTDVPSVMIRSTRSVFFRDGNLVRP